MEPKEKPKCDEKVTSELTADSLSFSRNNFLVTDGDLMLFVDVVFIFFYPQIKRERKYFLLFENSLYTWDAPSSEAFLLNMKLCKLDLPW